MPNTTMAKIQSEPSSTPASVPTRAGSWLETPGVRQEMAYSGATLRGWRPGHIVRSRPWCRGGSQRGTGVLGNGRFGVVGSSTETG